MGRPLIARRWFHLTSTHHTYLHSFLRLGCSLTHGRWCRLCLVPLRWRHPTSQSPVCLCQMLSVNNNFYGGSAHLIIQLLPAQNKLMRTENASWPHTMFTGCSVFTLAHKSASVFINRDLLPTLCQVRRWFFLAYQQLSHLCGGVPVLLASVLYSIALHHWAHNSPNWMCYFFILYHTLCADLVFLVFVLFVGC